MLSKKKMPGVQVPLEHQSFYVITDIRQRVWFSWSIKVD